MQPPQYNYGPPPPQVYNSVRPPMGPPSQGGNPNQGPSSYSGYQQQPYPGAYQQQQSQQMPHVNSFPGQQVPNAYQPQQPFMPSQNYQQSYQQYSSGPSSFTQPPSTGAPQVYSHHKRYHLPTGDGLMTYIGLKLLTFNKAVVSRSNDQYRSLQLQLFGLAQAA